MAPFSPWPCFRLTSATKIFVILTLSQANGFISPQSRIGARRAAFRSPANLPSSRICARRPRGVFMRSSVASDGNMGGNAKDSGPESQSVLERIKAARAYQRKNKDGTTLDGMEDDILEIEKKDESEKKDSQFGTIKSTLENLQTLDQRGAETDRKAYELLKKLGIPSPEPFVDETELQFPSDEIKKALE
eukprot:CAMPEP_0197515384 /NCGR_PEP_ID=MMETSP1318-20131121/538_1 /TAXON_ID=552666 /ORGANISM="Partenskyella glossopodia, Strain RCC365" /LENGTH=189 /DNA_ID=CAMNT_0043063743 /DNA_START=14 /DNA_END=583 /DNA_ORIENTATION=+